MGTAGRSVVACVIALSLTAGLAARRSADQQAPVPSPAPAKGVILGRVLDASTQAPIPNVIVRLSGTPLPRSIAVLTDAQGHFLFRNVPKGTFSLAATVGGNGYSPSGFLITGPGQPIGAYLSGGFGQRRPGGQLQSIDLADGERIADLMIHLWKGASIDGTVLDEAGEPLVNVVVAAARRSSDGRLLNGPSTRTDDRGSYHLGTLVPGEYVVVVPQMLAAMPGATDEMLLSSPDRHFTARLANTGAASVGGGLTIGNSVISNGPPDLNSSMLTPVPHGDVHYIYQTTFAPAATSLELAAAVSVASGEERMGINIAMQPVRGVAVSGTLSDDAGLVSQFGVRLLPRDADDGSGLLDVGWTSTDAQGRFTFPLVAAGTYRVLARRYATTFFSEDPQPMPPPARVSDRPGASAQQEIVVGDRDLSGVSLQLRQGVKVSGHLVFRGSGNRPAAGSLRQVRVVVGMPEATSRVMANQTYSSTVNERDEFVIQDVPPGRGLIWSTDVPGWSMLAVTVAERPVIDRYFPIENADVADVTIELTDRPAEIAGAVRARSGAAGSDASVVLFPTDRTRWRDGRMVIRTVRRSRVSINGSFTLSDVPPDEYFVAALPDESTADFPDARFFIAVAPLATKINVTAGGKLSLTLTTVDAPIAKSPLVTANATSVSTESNPAVCAAPALTGVVTTDETPAQIVRHAIVTATASESAVVRQAVTDDDGRFVFAELPPGRYSLTADKAGYVKGYYGSKRPGHAPGTPIAVFANQPAADIIIRMLRGAVIAGVVRDSLGAALASAQVSVKRPVVVNGERRMVDVPNLIAPFATTDEQGRYRIYGLPPGEYTVFCAGAAPAYSGVRETDSGDVEAVLRELRAGASSASNAAPQPAEPRQVSMLGGYVPGVPDVQSAHVFTLGPGEERTGADITARLVRAMRVEGIALGPGGTPMQNAPIAIVNVGEGRLWGSTGIVRPGSDGRFVLPPLTPGRYALVARAGENGAPESASMLYAAETEFIVNDRDISGLVLQFGKGASVMAQVVTAPGSASIDLRSVRLRIAAVDTLARFTIAPPAAMIQPDNTFRFEGIGPGRWRVTASLPAGWSLRSIMSGGRDTLDVPLEVRPTQPIAPLVVTVTDKPTEVTGTVFDASGQPTSEYSMLAFSTDRSLWSTAPRRVSGAVRLSSDGRYRIGGLPPGDYYLVAITDFDPTQLGDAAFLQSLIPAATRITLGEGEHKVQNFKVAG